MELMLWFFFLNFLYCAYSEKMASSISAKEILGQHVSTKKLPDQDFIFRETHSKADVFWNTFKKKIVELKSKKEIELVILVDGSYSIGPKNFKSEIKFIQKIISDVEVGPKAFRLGVVIYSTEAVIHINHLSISNPLDLEKCSFLHFDIPNIVYPGLNTNTKAALEKADMILSNARKHATKVIFLLTDGFSNLGDPTPVAKVLKEKNVTIYTFGIKNGNKKELFEIASKPTEEHAYLFDSFNAFESFSRKSLHADLSPGVYAPVKNITFCNYLCPYPGPNGCCSQEATCSCGLISGHFACLCPPGHYGSGLLTEGCTPCPQGTYSEGFFPGDILTCLPCPDINHITKKYPASNKADCICKERMVPHGDTCKIGFCPKLSPPTNGYFVTKNCSNAINAACGVRCFMGHILTGSSVRICNKNGTWSGIAPSCKPKTCKAPKAVPNSHVICSDVKYLHTDIDYVQNGTEKMNDFNQLESDINYRFKRSKNDILIDGDVDSNFTVGTECFYSCLSGHSLIGSKSRGCLPMLKWSGLKPTCKKIECPALKEISKGNVEPKNCTAKKSKHNFGDVCKFSCVPGYELQGPKFTNCTGKHGVWSEKNNPSRCVDVEPPTIECPLNITSAADKGMPYATLNLTLPKTKDNSGKDPILWSKPSYDDNHPLRLEIGVTEIQIYSVDGTGNYGFCSFSIEVKDTENPKILECQSPPIFFVSEFPPNSSDFTWKEPVFDDNSGVPLSISRNPSVSHFTRGVTPIVYTATDSSMNTASCILNITILENPCDEKPEESNTIWNCSNPLNNTVRCRVSCPPDSIFAHANISESVVELECTFSGRKAYWSPDFFHGDIDLFPECSAIHLSKEETTEIVIEASDKLCDDLEALAYDVNDANKENENFTVFIFCEDEIFDKFNENKMKNDLEGVENSTINDFLSTESSTESESKNTERDIYETTESDNKYTEQGNNEKGKQDSENKTLFDLLENFKNVSKIDIEEKEEDKEMKVEFKKEEKEKKDVEKEDVVAKNSKNSESDEFEKIGINKKDEKIHEKEFENKEGTEETTMLTLSGNHMLSISEKITEESLKAFERSNSSENTEAEKKQKKNTIVEKINGDERKGENKKKFDKSNKINGLFYDKKNNKTLEEENDVGSEKKLENKNGKNKKFQSSSEKAEAETKAEEKSKEFFHKMFETSNDKLIGENDESKHLVRSKRKASQKRKKKLKISFKSGDSKELNTTTEILKKFYLKHEDSEIIKLNISSVLKCENGSVLKNTICVKCPRGTFHNFKRSRCEPCPLGHYQEVEGQITCTRCELGYSTRKTRRKHSKHCKKICPPGTYGKKTGVTTLALSPCTTCPKGTYQPVEGQTSCQNCPPNFTTRNRGTKLLSLCVKKDEINDICTTDYCNNGGTCSMSVEKFAFCKCPPGFTGSFCEKFFDPCDSEPCYNAGQCRRITYDDYECICPAGFEGVHCEKEKNECLSNPCGMHGKCLDLLEGYRCDCFTGFQGVNCSEKIDYCENLKPCMNFGSCVETNGTYICLCPQGFSGNHCEVTYDCLPETCHVENDSAIVNFDPCFKFFCPKNMKCEVQWNRQPTCTCFEGFRGVNCTEEINSNVILKFPKYGVTEYLIADFPERDLTEISVCVWIKTKDNFNYGTLFSYATRNQDNMFTLTDYSGVVLYVSGNHVVTDLQANDGLWHYICVTWQSRDGLWQVYLDGSLFSKGTGLANNVKLPGKGKLVVGQEQDSYGGSFNQVESFAGQMTKFDIWDRILTDFEIKNFFENCENVFGNLILWPQLLQKIYGDIQEETSLFCTSCNSNLQVAHGKITYDFANNVKLAIYTCDVGFVLKFDFTPNTKVAKYYSRKCMKYGDWDIKEPICGRVACGFPGHFLRGNITGNSYRYGDKIIYHCSKGYTLEGNNTRICLSSGNWSGEAPYCRAYKTECTKLLAPRHGSMFVYFNNIKPYSKSILSQGNRVEFTCDKGFKLKGLAVLLCMEGGIWNSETPTCEEIKCGFPTGNFQLLNSSISKNSSFQENDNLEILCFSGERRIISCGKLGTWNFTSSTCHNKCFEGPKNPPNGYVLMEKSENLFDEGEKLFIKCLPGFYLFGDDYTSCAANGSWIQTHKSICLIISCGPPPRPSFPYFISYEEGFNYGDKIFLECAQGFKSSGEISIQCKKDGTYSPIEKRCIRISCGKPSIPDGYRVKHNMTNFFYGSRIEIECLGKKFTPDKYSNFIECHANGSWSTALECV